VITFSLNDDDRFIDAEIYICVDVAEEQASEYKVSLSNELLRLAVHGTLHLCGYKDKSEEEQKLMRQLEDKYLG
jgi:rRNA maturation RNase YbeY